MGAMLLQTVTTSIAILSWESLLLIDANHRIFVSLLQTEAKSSIGRGLAIEKSVAVSACLDRLSKYSRSRIAPARNSSGKKATAQKLMLMRQRDREQLSAARGAVDDKMGRMGHNSGLLD